MSAPGGTRAISSSSAARTAATDHAPRTRPPCHGVRARLAGDPRPDPGSRRCPVAAPALPARGPGPAERRPARRRPARRRPEAAPPRRRAEPAPAPAARGLDAAEVDRLLTALTPGRDGRLDERLRPGTGTGAWAGAVTAANDLVDELVRPTVEVGRVLGAVAAGDLTQTIDLRSGDQRLRGEFLRMARTVNGMVAQLRDFADEVSRVAREVGTDGKLGGQARVRGVSGTWRDLTDNVNSMANN